jgi:hypothetical protein
MTKEHRYGCLAFCTTYENKGNKNVIKDNWQTIVNTVINIFFTFKKREFLDGLNDRRYPKTGSTA